MAAPLRTTFRYDVFLSHSSADKPVVRELAVRLREAGLRVWLDEWIIRPGDHIPTAIEEGLEHSAVLLFCMSAHAFGSDWVGLEGHTAIFRDPLNRKRRFVPLRLDDAPIKAMLKGFAYLDWRQGVDREVVWQQLLRACWPDCAPTIVPEAERGRQADSPLPHPPAFSPHRDDEIRCCTELDKPRALIRIRAPKGFGKLSFTARLVTYAKAKGYRTVELNLIRTDRQFFENPERFARWFCAAVGSRLDLPVPTETDWSAKLPPNDNATNYFEGVLLQPDKPMVLVIHHFERIFDHPAIEIDFCGLLRSWYEAGASQSLWERFRLVLSHSREPYLLKASNHSPFNVGSPVELKEWRPDYVRSLVALHGVLLGEAELAQLLDLVGGHPYLVGKALQELAHGLSFSKFLEEAATEEGVYGDHLREILKAAEDHPDLEQALRLVVRRPEPVSLPSEAAFKLQSLGVVVPMGNFSRSRCRLYTLYLAERLGS
jgi:hypothetical protein